MPLVCLSFLCLGISFYCGGSIGHSKREYYVSQPLDGEEEAIYKVKESQYFFDVRRYGVLPQCALKVHNRDALTSLLLGMGPEFSSDMTGDGPRKRNTDDEEFDPGQIRRNQRKAHNSRRSKATIKRAHSNRTKADREADNLKQHAKRNKLERVADSLKQHAKRTKLDRQADNLKQNAKRVGKTRPDNLGRKMKSDMSGMEYDVSSPFPPTSEQLNFTGQILSNAIAGLFAQQSPSPEMSYAVVVAEQLKTYLRPLIDFTMHQFRQECCGKISGDINYGKAAGNKALDTLDKILLINGHYQLMGDFEV